MSFHRTKLHYHQWDRLCALRHGIQNSMEAILACHPILWINSALHTVWHNQSRSEEFWKMETLSPCEQDPLIAVEPRRPPTTTNEDTETSFRHDHCISKKSKHLLTSEVSWCDQTRVDIELWWSTRLASRISIQKEPFPRSEFTTALIWTCWALVHRQMQILHQGIIWSPW